VNKAQETVINGREGLVLAHQLNDGTIIIFQIDSTRGEHGSFPDELVVARRLIGLDGHIEDPHLRTYELKPKQEAS
jgi:hypothetical protein